MLKRSSLILFVIVLGLSSSTQAYTEDLGIEDGDVADLEYKILEGEKIIDSGRVDFTISNTSLIRGFYKGVLGMKIGETKEFSIAPNDGYTQPDNELYGKTLDVTVTAHAIITNIRLDSNSESIDTSNSEIIDTSDLVESETAELSYSLHLMLMLFSVFVLNRLLGNNRNF